MQIIRKYVTWDIPTIFTVCGTGNKICNISFLLSYKPFLRNMLLYNKKQIKDIIKNKYKLKLFYIVRKYKLCIKVLG